MGVYLKLPCEKTYKREMALVLFFLWVASYIWLMFFAPESRISAAFSLFDSITEPVLLFIIGAQGLHVIRGRFEK